MDKKELTDALAEHKSAMDAKVAEIESAKQAEIDGLKSELSGMEEKRETMQKQLDNLDVELQKAQKAQVKKEEFVSLEKSISDLLVSEDFKAAQKEGFRRKSMFEVKADTSDITGTINMTRQNLSVKFDPDRALAFIPYLNTGTIGKDKNEVLWVEGTYTSNAGYVGEGTGAATGDAGTAEEKTRKMAKISAKLILTDEMLNDASYVASAFRMKMQERAMLFTDGECYDGDGNDSTAAKHIYGIQGQSTAYNVTTTGSAASVPFANIGDLVDDTILQAELSEQRGLNKVWINPKTFSKFRKAKDENGQYLFVKAPNGSYSINGLDVIRSSRVTANTMLVADAGKIQLWWKRNLEVKFGQMNGTDMVDDQYTAVLFMRNQVIVETPDQTALIYVADVDAAIAALNKL